MDTDNLATQVSKVSSAMVFIYMLFCCIGCLVHITGIIVVLVWFGRSHCILQQGYITGKKAIKDVQQWYYPEEYA